MKLLALSFGVFVLLAMLLQPPAPEPPRYTAATLPSLTAELVQLELLLQAGYPDRGCPSPRQLDEQRAELARLERELAKRRAVLRRRAHR